MRRSAGTRRSGQNGRRHGRQAGAYALPVVERFGNCIADRVFAGNRAYAPDPRSSGIYRPSTGRRPGHGRRLNRVPRRPAFDRQFLHARGSWVSCTLTGKSMLRKSPLPDDMEELLEQLRLDAAMEADARLDDDFDDDDREVEADLRLRRRR